jgi:hypothetical protein
MFFERIEIMEGERNFKLIFSTNSSNFYFGEMLYIIPNVIR